MTFHAFIAALFAATCMVSGALADVGALADTGQRVILHDDGTWSFAPPPGTGSVAIAPQPGPGVTAPGMPPVVAFGTDKTWRVADLSAVGQNWLMPGYDDSAWQRAVTPWRNAPSSPAQIKRMENTAASWIWKFDDPDDLALRKRFTLGNAPSRATIRITADNAYTLYVNGQLVGQDTANSVSAWDTAEVYDITAALWAGDNVIAIVAGDYGGASGLLADVDIRFAAGAPGSMGTGVPGGPGTVIAGPVGTTGAGVPGSAPGATGQAAGGAAGATGASAGAIVTDASWKVASYAVDLGGTQYQLPSFDDSQWRNAVAGWASAPAAPGQIAGMQRIGGQWVWHPDHKIEVALRKTFDLVSLPGSARLTITGDDTYWVHVNGGLVGSNEGQGVGAWREAESYDITAYLQLGRNAIVIDAIDYTQDTGGVLAELTFGAGGNAGAGAATGSGPVAVGPATSPGQAGGASVSTGGQTAVIPGAQVGLVDVDVYQYSYRNWNNANFATHPSVTLGSNVGGIPNTARRIYVAFNHKPFAQAIAAGARVKLRMSVSGTAKGQPQINVFRVATPWNVGTGSYHSGQDEPNARPGEISWTNQPSIDMSHAWLGKIPAMGAGELDFDITHLVAAWVRGQYPNHGLVIMGGDESGASYQWIFDASESRDPARRPKLVIEPVTAPGGTAAGAVPGVGSGGGAAPTGGKTMGAGLGGPTGGGQPGGGTGGGASPGGGTTEPGNLIVNGSFEQANEGNGQTSGIPGWRVSKGNVDVVGSFWQQIDGRYSIDLAGTPVPGAIEQDVRTEPGASYVLKFSYAGNPACEAPEKWMRIYFDDDRTWAGLTFSTENTSLSDMGWRFHIHPFVAVNPVTRLRFESMGENQTCGFVIDDVQVFKQ